MEISHLQGWPHLEDHWLFILATVASLAIWWMVLGSFLAMWPGVVRAVFPPFGDKFDRKHAKYVMVLGLAVGILWAGGIALLVMR
jgi:MFS family permease